MPFWKNLAAGMLESAASQGEKQRDLANKILETHGDRLSEEQQRKVEAYAYSYAPEEAREIAKNLRGDD